MLQSQPTPKVFISYSHDSTAHKAWVLTLATRLEGNGVAVTLDQWDLKIGGDLPHFMESGLSDSDRVIVVCTDEYVRKANAMQSGGVGYEKRPPRGENPFNRQPVAVEPIVFDIPESFVSPALTNTVTFNPTLNNGKFWVGAGDMAFELSWSRCSKGSIWIYNRQESIHSLRIPTGITEIEQINNAECNSFYNEDSSTSLKEGELAVLQNKNGYYLAVKIERVLYRGRHADDRDELIFSYVIAPAKSISFSRHV
ncbi:toll/interleukin-1 receptor domain-containing protein [Salmonella enterica]|nr:toll/interleukin-1 receptor domain-containing protein [Salmonella enterica]EJP6250329.1 toll/interleukin-1 receptor domain-containing protein [Salmonella enterica]